MDTLAKVKAVAEQGMFATSLDLSDAYHHVPMREGSHVYLCFQVKDKRYMYMVLPFGLMTAPWAFTQVVKQIKICSSSHHLILFQYLDDWLNLFRSRGRARVWTLRLVRLCEQLRLLVNQEKSEAPAYAIHCIPMREARSGTGSRVSNGRAASSGSPSTRTSSATSGSRISSRGVSVGTVVSDGAYHTIGSHAYETVSTRRHPSGSHGKRRRSVGSSERSVSARTAMVDTWSTLGNRHFIPSRTPTGDGVHRRVIQGLGCSVQRDHVEWDVAEIKSPHQLAGAQSGVSRNPTSPVQVESKEDDFYDRQRGDGVLPKEAGGTRSRALLKLSMRIMRLAHRLQINMVPRHTAG